MCGRYTLYASPSELGEIFRIDAGAIPDFPARYNIAPTDPGLIVRASSADGARGREARMLRWGLVPHWVDDPEDFPTLVNARSETVREKASFRDAYRRRRCLVPASGFYEWQKRNGKQPYYFRRRDGLPLALAGLWEQWEHDGGERLESYTILTTDANDLVEPVHPRMPVVLNEDGGAAWLDPDVDGDRLAELLRAAPEEGLEAYPVTRKMNSPAFDEPEAVEPLESGRPDTGDSTGTRLDPC